MPDARSHGPAGRPLPWRIVAGDWSFARRPFWLFSHVFAFAVVTSFVFLGFWQLDRLDQRRDANALIESRTADTLVLDASPDAAPDGADLDYRRVEAEVRFLDPDFARIANRSQGGAAGEHVVAIVELVDGSLLAVNRGFVPLNDDRPLDPVPEGATPVRGWLRATVEQERFGATDSGDGDLLPRFDTERLAFRLGRPLPPVWLQLEAAPGSNPDGAATGLPEPIPLPALDDGPHLGYAVQWFIFAALGVIFYGLLLWRRASGHRSTVVTAAPSGSPSGSRT